MRAVLQRNVDEDVAAVAGRRHKTWAPVAAVAVAVLLSGCAGSGAPMPGSPGEEVPGSGVAEPDFSAWDPPTGKDVTEWGCEEEWLSRASVDGFFDVAVRNDLVRSTSLPAIEGVGEVAFISPAICVFDTWIAEAPETGTSRIYIFDDGVPQDLAASFEASGWHGFLHFTSGFPEATYSPTTEILDARVANIRTGVNAAVPGDMRGDLYVLSLGWALVEELDG